MQSHRRQYSTIKAKYRDAIILFRSGNFYESFGNDAKLIAEQLGIRLSKLRGNDLKYKASFQSNCLETYLHGLVKKGNKVAICEQLESPRKFKKTATERLGYI
jgi:DNA mismatch repair protein MutS